ELERFKIEKTNIVLDISHRFFFQAEDGIRDFHVTGVQTCALPICTDMFTDWNLILSDMDQYPADRLAYNLNTSDLRVEAIAIPEGDDPDDYRPHRRN